MFINILCALLIVAALYCGAMWLWIAGVVTFGRRRLDYATMIELERQTFHLGLCFIVAIGFLGMIWRIG